MFEFILAIAPIVWLIVALCVLKIPGWQACGLTALLTGVIAFFAFDMGLLNIGESIIEGSLNALWPICLVIIAALFVYNLTVKTGAMEEIKKMLADVSENEMVILLLIGWGFGHFMEGMAGFGTAVAIPAGILVAMGYDPVKAVIACLVANSTPTAFGSVGVPTTTEAGLVGLAAIDISGNIALMQCVITFITPFIMVWIVSGSFKEVTKCFPICLVAGLSFVVPETLAAIFIGPELPDMIGSIVCMIAIVIYALATEKRENAFAGITLKSALVAWSPFILIFVVLLLTSSLVPFIHEPLATISSKLTVYSGENPNTLSFSWIDTPGVKIIIVGFIGGFIQKASLKDIVGVLFKTLVDNLKTIFTICSVLSVAKIMGYSGMISTIAAVLVAVAGGLYPLISPLIGMIGGFVTGSGTSTAVLFGTLQAETATSIGASTVWLSAANLVGAGIGKMISPQGIAIGCAASGLEGQESLIFGKTVVYAILYIIIAGIICFVFA